MEEQARHVWTLDDFKDFATIDKVFFSNNTDCTKSDSEGYTPLCFAALNGVAPECISYFMWKGNGQQHIFDKCDRGKTPLQYACMAMNAITVERLINGSYEYLRFNEDGSPAYKQDEYGDTILDSQGNPAQQLKNCIPWKSIKIDGEDCIVYQITNDKTSTYSSNGDMILLDYQYTCATVSDQDITSAASLQKPDILKAFLSNKDPGLMQFSEESFKDTYGNNPLHLAVSAQCYASVDLLFEYDSENDKPIMTSATNNDNKTPLDIAYELGDAGLQAKLIQYYASSTMTSIVSLDKIAEYNFKLIGDTSAENKVLTSMFKSKYTFYILPNNYKLSDNETDCNLLDYCRNKSSDVKDEMVNSMCNVFTDLICTSPKDNIFGLIKIYSMFIARIVAIQFTEIISTLYSIFEDARDAQETPEWITNSLNADGHDASWTSKDTMLNSIENLISEYIVEEKYPEDKLYNDGIYVIPPELWNLDYLINNNFDKALYHLYIAIPDISVKTYQRDEIEDAVIHNKMDYTLVSSYTSNVNACIINRNYAFLNWLHIHSEKYEFTYEDLESVSNAVSSSILNSSFLTGWPWDEPSL